MLTYQGICPPWNTWPSPAGGSWDALVTVHNWGLAYFPGDREGPTFSSFRPRVCPSRKWLVFLGTVSEGGEVNKRKRKGSKRGVRRKGASLPPGEKQQPVPAQPHPSVTPQKVKHLACHYLPK